MKLKNYLEQHDSIAEEIDYIKANLSAEITDEIAQETARHINVLAGKLNIHLTMEDKYLYPNLMAKESPVANYSINEYVDEMGGLATAFTEFKNKYNTKQKLLLNKDSFKTDARNILDKILRRIKKEETTIYTLID